MPKDARLHFGVRETVWGAPGQRFLATLGVPIGRRPSAAPGCQSVDRRRNRRLAVLIDPHRCADEC
jgi:hypothetical protein